VLAPIHHPLHIAQRMATLDILSRGRVDVGIGRTGYPYQLTPYGTDLRDTRGMWQEFADVLPRIWTQEEISYDGAYYKRREVLPKPLQHPHPPLWSAYGSDDRAPDRQPSNGRVVRQRRGADRVRELMAASAHPRTASAFRALRSARHRGGHSAVRRRAGAAPGGAAHASPLRRGDYPAFPAARAARRGGLRETPREREAHAERL
jgi:alkanesulfonate monooxygenase SsuD/methylene tetrahydromethanopterin reductase-like flavin-dependent oxidoreductase (luciferase family)